MKRIFSWIAGVTVEQTLRAAILCTVASLGCMVLQTVLPIPLLLVVGMGVSHGLGVLGVMLFGLSVLKEVLALPNGAPSSNAAGSDAAGSNRAGANVADGGVSGGSSSSSSSESQGPEGR